MTDPRTAPSASQLARAEVADLPMYNAGLSSEAVRQRYGVTRIVRLASNENPAGASPAVARALTDLVSGIGVYPDASSTDLREAIGERVGVAADRIVVGNGSENLLELLCQAFLSPGDHTVTLIPSFGLHEIYPRMMGATVAMVPVTHALEFDVDAWCAALAVPTKMVLLSNPSNPVGCMLDDAQFRQIIDAAPDDTLLVIDEAYYEYATLAQGFPDALKVLHEQHRPWIVLRTFSKAWGLAGLRVGYGIASDNVVVSLLDRVRTPFNVNIAAQRAALAAWSDVEHMQHSVADTVRQRDVMARQLTAMGLRFAPSAANFLFVDLGRPNGPVTEALLSRGVIVKPWKEAGYERFIRVSIGSASDNAHFIKALTEALAA
jgi:histidinol-phosphate aminotransferase